MKREELLKTVEMLSKSQGFYSRLWESLCCAKNEDPEVYEATLEEWENQNFSDEVEFVMYLES